MIRSILTGFLTIALCLAFVSLIEAKTLYVDINHSNCSDATTYDNNSESSPWCSIGRAAWGSTNRSSPNSSQAVAAGDTVIVKAGTYSAPGTNARRGVTYATTNNGSEGNRITFQAEGLVVLEHSSGAGPVIGATSLDGVAPGGNRNYITWKGFTIYEVNAPAMTDGGMAALYGGSHNTIEDCNLVGDPDSPLGGNHVGIWVAWTNNCAVKNSRIGNVRDYGTFGQNGAAIMTYHASNLLFENNEIYDSGSGIFIKGVSISQGGEQGNITIRYNFFHHAHSEGKAVMFGDLSDVDGSLQTTLVYQNIVINWRNNMDMTNQVTGQPGYYYFVNNTLIGGQNGFRMGGSSNSEEVVFRNNIIFENSNEGINAGNWRDVSVLNFDRNVYYNSGNWSVNGQAYRTLANWQAAFGSCPGPGNECDSITLNPLFVNVNAHDYRLQSESPARTLGRTITAIHGTSGQIIPAGAYIRGNENIGPGGALSAPRGLRIIVQ